MTERNHTDWDFWDRWKAHYDRLGIELWAKDGAGDGYETASPRALFVMKEPNKPERFGNADVRLQLNKGPQWQVWFALGRWAAALFNDLPEHDAVTKAMMADAMRRVAVINVKKQGGGASANAAVLNVAAHRDRELLREQLDSLRPDVVIACGTFSPLVWLLGIPTGVDLPKRGGYRMWGKTPVVRWRHPARANRRDYDAFRDAVRRAVGDRVLHLGGEA